MQVESHWAPIYGIRLASLCRSWVVPYSPKCTVLCFTKRKATWILCWDIVRLSETGLDLKKRTMVSAPGAVDQQSVTGGSSGPKSDALITEKVTPSFVLEVDNQPRDATEDEVKTLRHVNDRIPIAAWIVILAGAAERATYFGIIAPWRTLHYYFSDSTVCRQTDQCRKLHAECSWQQWNSWSTWAWPIDVSMLSGLFVSPQYQYRRPRRTCLEAWMWWSRFSRDVGSLISEGRRIFSTPSSSSPFSRQCYLRCCRISTWDDTSRSWSDSRE